MTTNETPEARMLRTHRIALGYSQQYVADAVGIQLRQYQRLEYDEVCIAKMHIETGLKICRLLGIDPYELVFKGGPVLFTEER